MEYDRHNGVIILENERDRDVILEAARIGLGGNAAWLFDHHKSIEAFPQRTRSSLMGYVFDGLAQFAACNAVSEIISPDEAEECLTEVFKTSSYEQLRPVL